MHLIRLDFVLVRAIATLVVVLAVTLSSWWPAASVSSAAEMPIGATLKVLALPVEVQAAPTQTFVAAMDGQMLNQGDVVRTGPGGLALLTFFDGSESQLGTESTVQIERAEATPAPQIALLQTSGVTMNHVVPMPPGGSFQTDTPAATGLVRGTSYVVVVGDSSGAAQSAAPGSQTCGVSGDRSCATSVILLTDRDGHVGRVDVAAAGAPVTAAVRLARAGDAAGSDGGQTAAAHVAAARLQALEAGANARALPDAARDAERHAHVVATALSRGNAKVDGQDALEAPTAPAAVPGAQAEPTDRFEATGHAVRAQAHAEEQRQVTSVSVPAAAVAGTDDVGNSVKSKDSQQSVQSAQSVQSGQSEQSGTSAKIAAPVPAPVAPPAATVSRTVPAPPAPAVSVPAASGANTDTGNKPAKPVASDKPNTP
jgi:hypothetical protein